VENAVSLGAECAEEWRSVVVVVVYKDHAMASYEGQMSGDLGGARLAQRGARGAHQRHRGVGMCTRGTSGTACVEIQGMGSGAFGGEGSGSGFVGVGAFASSFGSSMLVLLPDGP
jgi:hypothetical protein